jgi:antitoxin (DNA-binding transcriptional repressor) of toxin-antitoxin stability system
MKTVTLRTLVREPIKVKRWTRAGRSVQVTDHGRPLWIIQPAATSAEEAERASKIDAVLDEVLSGARYGVISLSQIVLSSRR